jgi:hypothetical protein
MLFTVKCLHAHSYALICYSRALIQRIHAQLPTSRERRRTSIRPRDDTYRQFAYTSPTAAQILLNLYMACVLPSARTLTVVLLLRHGMLN